MKAFAVTTVFFAAVGATFITELNAQGRVLPPPAPNSPPVRAIPGPRYEAGTMHRFLLGSGWRELWLEPLTLPVLNLDTFAGGLEPEREGGGRQSMTLHFVDAGGKGWIFRSVDKYPAPKAEEEGLEGTLVGDLAQDQISVLHPAGMLVVPALVEALGVLHVKPVLFVMPDDPTLGAFRQTFAGMIGALELKPNEGVDDSPGFAGATKVIDTEVMFERAEESAIHAVAQRELLRARLLDFMIGDTDRTRDNHRWARFPHPEDADRYLWRPVPRDRDWAFMKPGGLVAPIARSLVFPKYVAFGARHSGIRAYTYGAHHIDRRFLNMLDRAAFDEETTAVKAMLNDSVIEAAVSQLPASYPRAHVRWMAAALKARRDALGPVVNGYYRWLAGEVDVRATAEPDYAEIVRHADGSVAVTLTARGRPIVAQEGSPETHQGSVPTHAAVTPYYHRVFRPEETNEIRIYLYGGNDTAVVRGWDDNGAIAIRVIGGGGDDVLADSSQSPDVHLYDAEGNNRFTTSDRTRLDTREWEPPATPASSRYPGDWAPDWGRKTGWGLAADFGESAGLILGAGPGWTDYGFRRLPYRLRVESRAMFAMNGFTPGAHLVADYRFENAPHSIMVDARWSNFDAFRWYGLGNDSERVADDQSLVRMERLSLDPSFVWRFGQWRSVQPDSAAAEEDSTAPSFQPQPLRGSLAVGPVMRYTTTDGSPAAALSGLQFESLWQLGARAQFEMRRWDRQRVPHRGWGIRAQVAAYPGMLGLAGCYGTARAEVNGYVPLLADGAHLALRAGTIRTFGSVPAFDAAAIGGRMSLRGFTSGRWAGDAATYGGAELRVPLGRMPWLFPAQVGGVALVDAGRVFVNGRSAGGWHTGYGGGAWFEVMDRGVSVAYARGERARWYAWLGLPF